MSSRAKRNTYIYTMHERGPLEIRRQPVVIITTSNTGTLGESINGLRSRSQSRADQLYRGKAYALVIHQRLNTSDGCTGSTLERSLAV